MKVLTSEKMGKRQDRMSTAMKTDKSKVRKGEI